MSGPRISIIMACYNAEAFLGNAIDSVLSQTFPDWELIVVDDGSTDRSQGILDRYSAKEGKRIRVFRQENRGPYPARNLGLARAQGELVCFLDADDWWDAHFLEHMTKALDQSDVDLTYCGWQNVGIGAKVGEPYVPPAYEAGDLVREFLKRCPWPIHAALVKRELLQRLGGFSENHFAAMDYDLWLRVLGHTRKIARVPEVLAFYRWHGSGQISAQRFRQVMAATEVRRRFTETFPEAVAHLEGPALRKLLYSPLLTEAYQCYWQRDLDNAQPLFRAALRTGVWRTPDLRYILPAWLPHPLFRALVRFADALRGNAHG